MADGEQPARRGRVGGLVRGRIGPGQRTGKVTALACSFCGKDKSAVQRMIAGPNGVFICNECIALCNEILAQEASERR